MGAISIRLAGNKDLKFIAGIEVAAAAIFSERDLPPGIRHRVSDMRDLRAAVARESLWIAVTSNHRIVGYAAADVMDSHAYLEELDVLPEFGRQGIGTRLLLTVVAWAKSAGFSQVRLLTFQHLPWNAPFYAKLGFEIIDVTERGPGIAGIIEEEARAGIDVSKRVAMRLSL